jgi:iron complex outermembrane recepter protein
LAALQAAKVIVFTCGGIHDTTLHTAPKWNFNISSEYDQPINGAVSGFVRGLMNYYTSNDLTGIAGFVQPSYATADLYLGLRHPDGQWEVALYGKNITNNRTVTSNDSPETTTGTLGNTFQPNGSGYFLATILPERELGVTLRYAFGSQ